MKFISMEFYYMYIIYVYSLSRISAYATHLPEDGWLRTEHELDVLAHISVAINPHESDQLPETCPKDSEPGPIGVHQIEHILP